MDVLNRKIGALVDDGGQVSACHQQVNNADRLRLLSYRIYCGSA